MSLLRFTGRALLASYFIGRGQNTWRHSAEVAQTVEPAFDRLRTWADQHAPAPVAKLVPQSGRATVRLLSLLDLVGAVLMATGLGRRLGAVLLIQRQIIELFMRRPAAEDEAASPTQPACSHRGRELALLGACLIESLDTQGRPGFRWRLKASRQVSRQQTTGSDPVERRVRRSRRLKARG
ncbi:MAG: DoxX family membrane protein [Propionibacteriaceae bacterium]|jgi:uncharacterized membrane protein YphA (DoxX/SURF4 family)|nr:DoxX family membrane protein [Propionibacteriaceae bacterium]